MSLHFRRYRQRVNGKTYTYLSIVHAVTEDAPVGMSFKEFTDLFKFVKATELASGDERCWQRTELKPERQEVLGNLGSRNLPTQWDFSIEKEIRRAKPQKSVPPHASTNEAGR